MLRGWNRLCYRFFPHTGRNELRILAKSSNVANFIVVKDATFWDAVLLILKWKKNRYGFFLDRYCLRLDVDGETN